MLSDEDVLLWQPRFKQKLPFRKLRKLLASVPLNMWWAQMCVHSFLPQGSQHLRDFLLYNADELYKLLHGDWALRTSAQGFTFFSYAKMVPSVLMFKQQVETLVGHMGQKEKLQDIWQRYGAVLNQGFGLQTPGMVWYNSA